MNHISMSRALALSASTVTACLPSRADTGRSRLMPRAPRKWTAMSRRTTNAVSTICDRKLC